MKQNIKLSRAYYVIGTLSSILPCLILTLCEFPLFIKGGYTTLLCGAAISSFSLFMLALSLAPLSKAIKAKIKTPSAPLLWGVASLVLYVARGIIDSLIAIAVAGFIGNLVGSVFFMLAEMTGRKKEYRNE